jgi:hypothetical protein
MDADDGEIHRGPPSAFKKDFREFYPEPPEDAEPPPVLP